MMTGESLQIRAVKEADHLFILNVNEENVEVLSPMDEAKLRAFVRCAELFLVAEVGGKPAAFLIALREGVESYDSENYRWFSRHYSHFLYIDRVVIDAPWRGRGLGRKLYEKVFEHARAAKVPYVTAEIDTIPYNEASLAFHKEMGFREVGVQMVRNNSVKVSLQERAVDSER